MRVLVTGGAGFVGSHLCEQLVSRNYNVTSLDNYFTGSENNHVDSVEYIKGSTENIFDILGKQHFDIVYHLGEYSRVEQSFKDIDLVWKYNKVGTYEVLKYVKDHASKLVYAGSSTKFADTNNGYIQSPYAWSKASNTELVKQYAEWYDINYVIAYFYNVYGPREISSGEYATLIAKFKEKMKNSEPLTVVSPGTQKRNFTHIDDIISGLVLVGEYGNGDEYGIGSPETFSVLEVAKMFGGTIEYLDHRPGNRLSAEIITKKTRELGWNPKHRLEDWVEYLRKNGWNDD